jgi:mannose-6-phosphate isomerase-like protein (cupin superfamily)
MGIDVTTVSDLDAEKLESSLAADGWHTLSLDVPPVQNQNHWHHFDAVLYILEGDLTVRDANSGREFCCGPGSRVSVPARALHREDSSAGYRIVLGTSVPATEFGDPVDLPPALLSQR